MSHGGVSKKGGGENKEGGVEGEVEGGKGGGGGQGLEERGRNKSLQNLMSG